MKKYCVVGHDVGYSRSPLLHLAAAVQLDIDMSFTIEDVAPENFAQWVQTKGKTFDGFAVTKPYKKTIMPLLDTMTKAAVDIDAVNTVTVLDGKMVGTNTDGAGAIAALGGMSNIEGKNILILGAGGAAKAITWALRQGGAKIIALWNRTYEKAQAIADGETVVAIRSLEDLDPESIDIIIQTTTVGLQENKSLLPQSFFLPKHTVMDIVYTPLETRLLHEAQQQGATCVTGDSMLVHQAALQFQIWNQKAPDIIIMQEAFFN